MGHPVDCSVEAHICRLSAINSVYFCVCIYTAAVN